MPFNLFIYLKSHVLAVISLSLTVFLAAALIVLVICFANKQARCLKNYLDLSERLKGALKGIRINLRAINDLDTRMKPLLDKKNSGALTTPSLLYKTAQQRTEAIKRRTSKHLNDLPAELLTLFNQAAQNSPVIATALGQEMRSQEDSSSKVNRTLFHDRVR